jgi:hypothetical protein
LIVIKLDDKDSIIVIEIIQWYRFHIACKESKEYNIEEIEEKKIELEIEIEW